MLYRGGWEDNMSDVIMCLILDNTIKALHALRIKGPNIKKQKHRNSKCVPMTLQLMGHCVIGSPTLDNHNCA